MALKRRYVKITRGNTRCDVCRYLIVCAGPHGTTCVTQLRVALDKLQEIEQKENSWQATEAAGSKQVVLEMGQALKMIQLAALRAKAQLGEELNRQARGMDEIRQTIRDETSFSSLKMA